MASRHLLLDAIRDTGRVILGFFSILWYVIAKDSVSVRFSYFCTPSQIVKPTHNCIYMIGLCNTTAQNSVVKLRCDIYKTEKYADPNGPHCYFEKDIFVRSCESLDYQLIFNWQDKLLIKFDDIDIEPDLFWLGKSYSNGKYVVRIRLLNEKNKVFDKLTLIQTLSNENC